MAVRSQRDPGVIPLAAEGERLGMIRAFHVPDMRRGGFGRNGDEKPRRGRQAEEWATPRFMLKPSSRLQFFQAGGLDKAMGGVPEKILRVMQSGSD